MRRPTSLLLLAALFCSLEGGARAESPASTSSGAEGWRGYVLEYARSRYPARLINGAPKGAKRVDFAWLFYLLRKGDRVVLVDTGFTAKRYRRGLRLSRYRHPRELLATLTIKPERVTDVVLTHGHFDHAGGLGLYPRARVWIGSRELKLRQRGRRPLARLLRRARATHRLRLVKVKRSLAPGLELEQAGGHTPGSMVLWLRDARRRCVFVGDECYLRRACRETLLLPRKALASAHRNRALLNRIAGQMTLTPKLRVYTGHDPGILADRDGRAVGAGVVEICR